MNHPHLIISDTLLQWKGCRISEKSSISTSLQVARKRLNRIHSTIIESKFRASLNNTTPVEFFVKYQEELHRTVQFLIQLHQIGHIQPSIRAAEGT
jgi:hypothetical protein